MLKARLFYGVLMILAILAVLLGDTYFAPRYPLFAIVIGLIVWIAAGELATLLGQLPLPVKPWFCQVGAVAVIWSNWIPHLATSQEAGTPDLTAGLVSFTVVGMLAFLLAAWEFRGPGNSTAAIAGHVLIVFYVAVLGTFLVQLRWLGSRPETGALAFFLTAFTAKTCDIGAYFTGRKFGRRKMAPFLSPGKTVEGSLGGLVSGLALAIAIVGMGKWLMGVQLLSWPATVVFGLVVGLTAQVGDLMESMIKRDCKQKDASDNIPGFGGIMDVIDSVLFCGPVAYLLLVALNI